jgi:hypothetical protein
MYIPRNVHPLLARTRECTVPTDPDYLGVNYPYFVVSSRVENDHLVIRLTFSSNMDRRLPFMATCFSKALCAERLRWLHFLVPDALFFEPEYKCHCAIYVVPPKIL